MHSVFFTAGYPAHRTISDQLLKLRDAHVDFVELGIPFSDPVADGTTIQFSSTQALNGGMNLEIIFHELSVFQGELPIPVVMMGYLNTLLAFGLERFVQEARRVGISALLIPDLPPELTKKILGDVFLNSGISPVFMVDPQTPENRIREIDALSDTFIYAVTKSATTGNSTFMEEDVRSFLKRLNAMQLKSPVLAGFGISNAAHRKSILPYAKGTIIGSAFIRSQMENREALFLKEISENTD